MNERNNIINILKKKKFKSCFYFFFFINQTNKHFNFQIVRVLCKPTARFEAFMRHQLDQRLPLLGIA